MKRKFYVGQKVGILWENTPYYAEGLLTIYGKVGVIKEVASHDSGLYYIIGANPNEPDKVYQFFDNEMIVLSSTTLNGDSL